MGYTARSATYYANGALHTLNVPGAPTITYALDGMGRTVGVATSGSPGSLVSSVDYGVLGITGILIGSGDLDTFGYDSTTGRMTVYTATVNGQADAGTLTWNHDGQLQTLAIADAISGTSDSQTCNYTHDDLGRVASVDCGTHWAQTFQYDPYGNASKTATTGTSFSASFNLSNCISSVGGFTPSYDSNGNLLDDPVTATHNVNAYDAEGRAVTFEGTTVVYGALGRAVEAGGHEFVYGPRG